MQPCHNVELDKHYHVCILNVYNLHKYTFELDLAATCWVYVQTSARSRMGNKICKECKVNMGYGIFSDSEEQCKE